MKISAPLRRSIAVVAGLVVLLLLLSRVGNSPGPEKSLHFTRGPDGQRASTAHIRKLCRRYGISTEGDCFTEGDSTLVAGWQEAGFTFFRISPDEYAWNFRYLAFRTAESETVSLGHIDLGGQKDGAPETDLVTMKGNHFLVIRSVGCTGTGVHFLRDTWWLLDKSGLKKALVVPAQGYVIGWAQGFERKFASTNRMRVEPEPGVVTYRYSASYWPGCEDTREPPIMETGLKGTWVWEAEERKFDFAPARSDSTHNQIEGLFNDGPDGFVKHNRSELEALREGDRTAAWLENLAGRCEKPQSRRMLRGLLERNGELARTTAQEQAVR